MYMANIFEAKAKLSDLLERAAAGERILICKRNQPVAELRPIAAPRTTPRPVGLAKGLVELPPAFFDPLPDDELEAFDSGLVYPKGKSRPAGGAAPPPRRGRRVTRRSPSSKSR